MIQNCHTPAELVHHFVAAVVAAVHAALAVDHTALAVDCTAPVAVHTAPAADHTALAVEHGHTGAADSHYGLQAAAEDCQPKQETVTHHYAMVLAGARLQGQSLQLLACPPPSGSTAQHKQAVWKQASYYLLGCYSLCWCHGAWCAACIALSEEACCSWPACHLLLQLQITCMRPHAASKLQADLYAHTDAVPFCLRSTAAAGTQLIAPDLPATFWHEAIWSSHCILDDGPNDSTKYIACLLGVLAAAAMACSGFHYEHSGVILR